jgi:hypothetical protein
LRFSFSCAPLVRHVISKRAAVTYRIRSGFIDSL